MRCTMRGTMWIVGYMAFVVSTSAIASGSVTDIPTADRVRQVEAAELKGDLARIHEQYGSAIYHYRAALKADPKNARLENKLGIAYLQSNDHGAARKAFTRSVKLDPHFVNALNNLGAVDVLDKKYNAAVRYLKQALALEETNASAHLNIAEAWAGLNQMDRAMTEYARALELNADILSSSPDGIAVHVRTPEQRARVSFLLAKAYAKRGNLEGALEYLRRAKEDHYAELAKVYQDEVFAGLWGDPRLEKIVKR
ncbi:tetratricopeptide repeat protein [Acidobacteria bacterium AB60]|nr:tetratricopeptide repeat protein [Acidobacteria bacterium AB60]